MFFCNFGVEVNEVVFKLFWFIGCMKLVVVYDVFYGCIMGLLVFIG